MPGILPASASEGRTMNRAILADEKMLELSPHGGREFPFILQRIVLSGYPAGTLQCHRHPEIEMIYILSGSMLFQINHHYLDVKEGDCLFINAGVLHGASMIGEQDCTYLCIDFHPDLIGGPEDSFFAASFVLPLIQSGTFSHTVMNRTHPSYLRISDSFRQLERLCREAERGYQLLIRSRLFEIWHIILHCFESCGYVPETRLDLRQVERLKAVLSFIYSRFSDDISLEDMAASCHLSKSEFSRLFKRAFRKTPVEFLSNFRIQRSLELLCCKQYTVTKVASMVGFSGSSYYSEVFRKVMLRSPSDYRRAHLSEPPGAAPQTLRVEGGDQHGIEIE